MISMRIDILSLYCMNLKISEREFLTVREMRLSYGLWLYYASRYCAIEIQIR